MLRADGHGGGPDERASPSAIVLGGVPCVGTCGWGALRLPFECVVPYSWAGRFGENQRFVSEGRWEQVRAVPKRTGRVQQGVWLAQWVSGAEGHKGVAHQQPKAGVGKKRKLTAG